jgi:hypothetical protein
MCKFFGELKKNTNTIKGVARIGGDQPPLIQGLLPSKDIGKKLLIDVWSEELEEQE